MMNDRVLNVLIACEESQRICNEFLKLGHNAYSCDLMRCSGGRPDRHILDDARCVLGGGNLKLENGKWAYVDSWDLVICHPPCTTLCVSGTQCHSLRSSYENRIRGRAWQTIDGITFFMHCIECPAPHVAVENPVGIMSSVYRKPDQYIEPYEFGDHARKKTGLWLKNLPKLVPTNIVDPGEIVGDGYSVAAGMDAVRDENGKKIAWSDPRTAIARSKTYPGIAHAIATQWSKYILENG